MKSKINSPCSLYFFGGKFFINTKSIGQGSKPPEEIGVMCYSAQMPSTPEDGYFSCGLC